MNTNTSTSTSFEEVIQNLPVKAKASPKTKPETEKNFKAWLEQAENPEEWIDICFRSESGIWGNVSENLWMTGIEKFGDSHVYLEALGCYYYRQKKPHKSLEALRPLLRKKPRELTIKVAMSAAHHLQQPRLVWEYFLLLSPSQRNQLEHDLLTRAANAAISLERFSEAEKIYMHLRDRTGSSPVPTLEESLLADFKSMENIKAYLSEMQVEMKKPEKRKKLSITEIIRYSSALMFHGHYDHALEVLMQVRSERYT